MPKPIFVFQVTLTADYSVKQRTLAYSPNPYQFLTLQVIAFYRIINSIICPYSNSQALPRF